VTWERGGADARGTREQNCKNQSQLRDSSLVSHKLPGKATKWRKWKGAEEDVRKTKKGGKIVKGGASQQERLQHKNAMMKEGQRRRELGTLVFGGCQGKGPSRRQAKGERQGGVKATLCGANYDALRKKAPHQRSSRCADLSQKRKVGVLFHGMERKQKGTGGRG